MKHPNVNRKYKYQIYIEKSAKVSAPITKLIITPTSHLKRTYSVCGNDSMASFLFTIYIYIYTYIYIYIYINDLPNCLMHSQPRMYADYTSITYASNDVEQIERCVNIDLDRIRICYTKHD